MSTLASIIKRINDDKNYNIAPQLKKQLLATYNNIICGEEKRYIVDDNIIKIQNNYSCRVNGSIFKAIRDIYGKNIFDRISFEKMYYFEGKTSDKSVRIRASKVLDTIGTRSIFIKGQSHIEEKTFNNDKTQIMQSEISSSRVRSFFENSEYDYVKKVEMITFISEKQIPRLNIYIKKLPNIENRIMDIYGQKEDIQKLIKTLTESSSRNVFNDIVSNSDYEDEHFTDYNLRFANAEIAINEELEIYELLKQSEG